MKKLIAFMLAIILLLSVSVSANAATPRFISINPELTFSGTTANCSVSIVGSTMSDEIDATIKLWRGSTCLRTWRVSDDGYLFWSGTATVTKGKTYDLTVDLVYNGVSKPRVSVSGTC